MVTRMGLKPPNSRQEEFARLPKVDLHRHLEGSMRLETLMDIVRVHGITLPLRPDFRSLVQVQRNDPMTVGNFLAKFQILRLFYRSPEIIRRITREVIEDAASDGVVHLDLHFTPVALSRYQNFALAEVMDWVIESAQKAAAQNNITVSLVASINRHESITLAEEVVRLAIERSRNGIWAVDLAGNEADFPAEPFAALFHAARSAGLAAVVHAGEWGGSENVAYALEHMHADRINHGVRVLESTRVTALARERGVPFAVCLTSNYQSGVVPSLQDHPILGMLRAGLNVTINTDDPGVSAITLSSEYQLVCDQYNLPRSLLAERVQAAANAALLPADQRAALALRLRQAWAAPI